MDTSERDSVWATAINQHRAADRDIVRGTLTLYTANGSWIVSSAEASNADDVRRLFGTTEIPSAFRATVDAITVRANIERLNPACTVVVR